MNENQIISNGPQENPLEGSEAVACPCGGKTFVSAFLVRKRSRILTGDATDAIGAFQVMACFNCGLPFQDSLPPELKENVTVFEKLV